MIRRATNIIMLHEAAHLHGKCHLIISNVMKYELKNMTKNVIGNNQNQFNIYDSIQRLRAHHLSTL